MESNGAGKTALMMAPLWAISGTVDSRSEVGRNICRVFTDIYKWIYIYPHCIYPYLHIMKFLRLVRSGTVDSRSEVGDGRFWLAWVS